MKGGGKEGLNKLDAINWRRRRIPKMKTLYVGNLPFNTTEEEVSELFEQHGNVQSVTLIKEHDTGKFRGFGFVEMDSADEAIRILNDSEFGGRIIKVSEAKPRSNSRQRG